MTPQRRGVIPEPEAERLAAAVADKDRTKADDIAANERLKAAVTAALLAGGSVREVAKAAQRTTATVEKWGRDGGWPSAEQSAAWEADRQFAAELRAKSEAAQAVIRHMRGETDG